MYVTVALRLATSVGRLSRSRLSEIKLQHCAGVCGTHAKKKNRISEKNNSHTFVFGYLRYEPQLN